MAKMYFPISLIALTIAIILAFVIDMSFISYPIVFFAGILIIVCLRTLFVRLEFRTEEKCRELRELNDAKDKFISVLAHDLKTPAANIESLTKMLKDNFDTLSEEEKKSCINMLAESANVHSGLLNELLELSRSRSGSEHYDPERLDLRKLVNTVFDQTKLQAQQKRINQVNSVEDCFIIADKNMITTVIRNFVVNAIKFTYPDGQITIEAAKNEQKVIISVVDTGIGIPDDRKDKIFGVGCQKSTTGTADEKGTGLGLLLCKEYVERHGGHLWFESEEGKGTTFFFTLSCF